MVTQDPRLSAELRFDLREFEPGSVLLEQLSTVATAAATGRSARKRFSRRAVAGVFAGVLLASGTAYATRGDIEPVLNSIVGHSEHHAPSVPRPASPRVVENGQLGPTDHATPRPTDSDHDQNQDGDRSGDSQDQRSNGGTSDSDQQQSSTSGTDGQDQTPSSGTDSSTDSSGTGSSTSGDGTSSSGDGSSTGQ